MKSNRLSAAIALAFVASLPLAAQAQTALPAPTSGSLDLWFKAPLAGSTVSGTISLDRCYVKGIGVSRVNFFVDGRAIGSDTNVADGMSCTLDTTTLTNGSHTLMATAVASNGSTRSDVITINVNNPVNTPPTVSITSPTASQSVTGALSYAANATDNAGVSRVEFRLDGTLINTDTSAPFGGSIATLTPGAHTLTATAFDAAGLSSTSTVSFTVPVPNTPPTVAITAPTASQSVTGTLNYAAGATDNAGVSRVEFRLDGTLINSDTTAPYGGSVAAPAPGTHTLTATAYDASGLNATSTVSFTVPQPTTTPTSPATPLPAPTAGSLDVWFKAPLSGATVSGNLALEQCYVRGVGVARVNFFVDGRAIGSDTNVADGMSCTLDTRTLANGTHQLMATAVSSTGSTRSDVISINVQNTATGGGTGGGTTPPANAAPTVSITSPTASQAVSGTLNYAANATDDAAVARVEFRLDGTLIATDTTAPFGGSVAAPASGAHTLTATAFDAAGLSSTSTVSFTVAATPPATPPTSNLPNGGSAVPTFHSLGLYWRPTSTPGSAGCTMQYRRTSGDTSWRQALNMWYDSRNTECRGSIVQLEPGTQYEVQFGVGSSFTQKVVASTWGEQFPIAQTITLPAGTVSQPVAITQGGSASGYVLYQAHPNGTTIDVNNAYDANVTISAPYVIVRGVTMRNARIHGVDIRSGAHHVVVENNDISGWGRSRGNVGGRAVGVDMDSGVRASCSNGSSINTAMNTFVIQRNRIRNPRYTANSWTNGHPAGPQAVTLSYCGGNHVIRYNDMANTNGNKFNDAIGGEDNFTQSGAPVSDSDIYGNLIVGAWDDGIEAEGSNRNVRIWGNFVDDTAIGIATTVTHHGPVYIFRNVYNRSRKLEGAADSDDRGPFFKAGSGGSSSGDGRRYVFHNTMLQPSIGATNPGGGGTGIAGNSGEPLTNTVTRNNIFHVWRSGWTSINQTSGGFGNDVDYDVYNGTVTANTGAQANGVRATPTYAAGHGPASGSAGNYQLAPTSPGFGRGTRLNNFNDDVAAPDAGAHQSGRPAMRFGVQ